MNITKTIKHNVKRYRQRLHIFNNNAFNSEDYSNSTLTDAQKKALTVCIKMINDPISKLSTSYETENKYIKNGNYFVVMGCENIQIGSSAGNCYDIQLKGIRYSKIKKLFNNRIELDRSKIEDEINENIKYSLDNMLKNINRK